MPSPKEREGGGGPSQRAVAVPLATMKSSQDLTMALGKLFGWSLPFRHGPFLKIRIISVSLHSWNLVTKALFFCIAFQPQAYFVCTSDTETAPNQFSQLVTKRQASNFSYNSLSFNHIKKLMAINYKTLNTVPWNTEKQLKVIKKTLHYSVPCIARDMHLEKEKSHKWKKGLSVVILLILQNLYKNIIKSTFKKCYNPRWCILYSNEDYVQIASNQNYESPEIT